MQKFLKIESGVVSILFAVSIPVIVALMGVVIETSRQAYVETKLTQAVDAAAIAAARYDTADAQANALKVFQANFPDGFMGTSVTWTFSSSGSGLTKTVNFSVQGSLPSVFEGVINIKPLKIESTTSAKSTLQGLEMALVLDITGSMSSNGKISGLRSAAKNMIDVISDGADHTNIYISLVPYVAAVNIGNTHTTWLSDPATLSSFPSKQTWRGCVKAGFIKGEIA